MTIFETHFSFTETGLQSLMVTYCMNHLPRFLNYTFFYTFTFFIGPGPFRKTCMSFCSWSTELHTFVFHGSISSLYLSLKPIVILGQLHSSKSGTSDSLNSSAMSFLRTFCTAFQSISLLTCRMCTQTLKLSLWLRSINWPLIAPRKLLYYLSYDCNSFRMLFA